MSVSLDNRGPSMWPHLSSSFYDLPRRMHLESLWKAHNGIVSLALCWWLREPWSSLAPNDLLSVLTALGHAPDPAGALGACAARGGPPLLLLASLGAPVPPHEWATPAHNPLSLS